MFLVKDYSKRNKYTSPMDSLQTGVCMFLSDVLVKDYSKRNKYTSAMDSFQTGVCMFLSDVLGERLLKT